MLSVQNGSRTFSTCVAADLYQSFVKARSWSKLQQQPSRSFRIPGQGFPWIRKETASLPLTRTSLANKSFLNRRSVRGSSDKKNDSGGASADDTLRESSITKAAQNVPKNEGEDGIRSRSTSTSLSDVREGAASMAHWCEALAKFRPSPFLPLYAPRTPRTPRPEPQASGQASDQQLTQDVPRQKVTPKSFFRRPLSAKLIPFNSAEGKKLLSQALCDESGRGASTFFEVMGAFDMQRDPVSCGLSSLSIALNALRHAPWRYESRGGGGGGEMMAPVMESEILAKLVPEELRKVFMTDGSSLEELASVARAAKGIQALTVYADQENSEVCFRQQLDIATSCNPKHMRILLVNFSRQELGQTGTGHFSPIAAYHTASDMALVLDTARFKYPAFWARVSDLWYSCSAIDKDSGRSRGSMTLWKE